MLQLFSLVSSLIRHFSSTKTVCRCCCPLFNLKTPALHLTVDGQTWRCLQFVQTFQLKLKSDDYNQAHKPFKISSFGFWVLFFLFFFYGKSLPMVLASSSEGFCSPSGMSPYLLWDVSQAVLEIADSFIHSLFPI